MASAGLLTLDPQELSRRISALALTTRSLTARSIQSRLHEIRVRYLEDKLTSGPSRLNSDLAPVAFFLSVSHWSAQFRGGGAGLLRFFSRVPLALLLGLPVFLFSLLLLVLRGLKKEAVFSLLPLALMGLTTIVAEIVLLIWYQAVYGFLYGRIALLLATFMLGLFLGGLYRPTLNRPASRRLAAVQIGFLIVLGVFRLALSVQLPEVFPFVILLVLGILGGSLFVISNRLYLRFRTDYGRGYGLDLIGSFSGALVTSSLLIPLAGLGRVIDWIIVVNIMGFLFYLARPRTGRPSD